MSVLPSAYGALDAALATLAEREYARLTERLSTKMQVERLDGVFKQFERMAKGQIQPAFTDPWVALFYLLWYQPSQISLFHSIFADLLRQDAGDDRSRITNDNLQIVDFGCGALAVQIGVTAACMELQDRQAIPHLAITNIDGSREMTVLGRDLCTEWERQLNEIEQQQLSDMSAMVSSKVAHYRVERTTNVNHDAARCLVASNVMFPSNLSDVTNQLALLWRDMEPDHAIIATIPRRASLTYAKDMLPGSQWISPPSSPIYRQTGRASKLSQWRQDLLGQLNPSPEYSIVAGYLKGDVLWDKGSPIKIGVLGPTT